MTEEFAKRLPCLPPSFGADQYRILSRHMADLLLSHEKSFQERALAIRSNQPLE
jgi:hypothetical protein